MKNGYDVVLSKTNLQRLIERSKKYNQLAGSLPPNEIGFYHRFKLGIIWPVVEQAMQLILRGGYGYCHCGIIIPAERLKAVPGALRCVDCQIKVEG